jgi:hypothetical protein
VPLFGNQADSGTLLSSAHAYYIPTTAWCGFEPSNVAYIYIGATVDVGKDNEVR